MPNADRTWPADTCRLRLGGIEIDLRYRLVRRGSTAFELNPRCFDLLLLFLREPGVLHSREAIFRKIWPDAVVDEASLTSSVWQLRRALGEGAKQWIRTVTKQGYVFDPPASIEFAALDASALSADDAAAPPVEPPYPLAADDAIATVVAESATRVPRSFARRLLPVAALLVATVGLGCAMLLRGPVSAPAPQRVVLVAADDGVSPDGARWPVVLLHAWIEWQLRGAPGLVVSGATETCDRCGEIAVVLGAEMSSRNDGLWTLSARYRGAGDHADVARVSTTGELVAAIDAVARDVVGAVAPSLGQAAALDIDAGVAEPLAQGLRLERQHRWNDAATAFNTVVERAPRFGFARVRLAQALDRLGQQSAARAQIGLADAWIHAQAAPLRDALKAQAQLIAQDYENAAVTLAALARDGDDAAYRPDEAYSLLRLGRVRDAAERLSGDVPARPDDAMRWLLRRAEIELKNYAGQQAAATAQSAVDLAAKFGWPHEQASAALLLALAGNREPALLDTAARQFEAAGDKLGALRARYLAQALAPNADLPPPHADELLAQARLAGNATVEIDTLLRAAAYFKNVGDIARGRELLLQAASVARSTGTPYERHTIDLQLFVDDIARLDPDGADQRIASLRAVPLQGLALYLRGVNDAHLAYLRGQYADALTTLDDTEQTLRTSGGLPQIARAIGCQRALSNLMLGHMAAARNDVGECRESAVPAMMQSADFIGAELAIHAGDPAAARRLLAPLSEALPGVENRHNLWVLAISGAQMFARAGDIDTAQDIVDRLLPRITAAQYRLLSAEAHVTRAEISLSRGKIDDAERDAVAAGALVPADIWYFQRRMRTVRALVAAARGQSEDAQQELASLHADTISHGDVLAELEVHSLMDHSTLGDRCSEQRHQQLLAESGMRGASSLWLIPPAMRGDGHVLVEASDAR